MALSDYKLKSSDISTKGVVAAPDKLTGTANENKMVFDRLIREALKDLFNGLIDTLAGIGGAAQIGITAIAGLAGNNVQAALESLKGLMEDRQYVTAGQKSGTTLGTAATAEGFENTASGNYVHAEGYNNAARAARAHVEGQENVAGGVAAHVEGSANSASGNYAHVEGAHNSAQSRSQHVFGEYAVPDSTGSASVRGTYIEVVGNGAGENSRSNARALKWNGDEIIAGKLTVGKNPEGNMDAATKGYVDSAVSSGGLGWFSVDAEGRVCITYDDGE